MRVTVNDNHAALIATVQTVRDDLRDHEHREMHMLDMRFDKVDADMREVRDRVFALTNRD